MLAGNTDPTKMKGGSSSGAIKLPGMGEHFKPQTLARSSAVEVGTSKGGSRTWNDVPGPARLARLEANTIGKMARWITVGTPPESTENRLAITAAPGGTWEIEFWPVTYTESYTSEGSTVVDVYSDNLSISSLGKSTVVYVLAAFDTASATVTSVTLESESYSGGNFAAAMTQMYQGLATDGSEMVFPIGWIDSKGEITMVRNSIVEILRIS
jgi:hypothetical protein